MKSGVESFEDDESLGEEKKRSFQCEGEEEEEKKPSEGDLESRKLVILLYLRTIET